MQPNERNLRVHDGRMYGGTAVLPEKGTQAFARKRILITGAGGWIGSALAQAFCAAPMEALPQHLVLLDSAESHLYAIDSTLQTAQPNVARTAILGSVADTALLGELFTAHAPQIVFHTAACKHVPLLESNPLAALGNNALGTRTALEAAQCYATTEQFLLLSTDKAAHPCGIMGASKRIAELIVLANTHPTLQTKVARLVNVYGAPGSVVPLFLHQIAHGGPLTVTHPEAERYFMDLPQAVALLLAIANPGVDSGLYLPHIATPTKILDLARRLLAEMNAPATVKIQYAGLRPGEKLTESLLAPQEAFDPNSAATDLFLRVQSPRPSIEKLSADLNALAEAVAQRNLPAALACVRRMVPEFAPAHRGADACAVDAAGLAPAEARR